MEPYPRTTTWPFVLLVLALFLAAVVSPRWWRSLDDAQRQVVTAKLTFQSVPPAPDLVPAPQKIARPRRVHVDFNPDWLRPRIARMNPTVAQRVIIEPANEQAAAETDVETRGDADASERPVVRNAAADLARDPHPPQVPAADPENLTDFDLKDVSSSLPSVPTRPAKAKVAKKPSEWPEPTSLLASLDEICVDAPIVEGWRGAAIDLLWRLQATDRIAGSDVPLILDELSQLSDVLPHVEKPAAATDRVLLRQIAYGIDRRVAVWRAAHQIAKSTTVVPDVNVADALPALRQVEAALPAGGIGESWRTYLRLEKLNQIATSSWVTDPSVRQDTARFVLKRISNRRLTERQREFLKSDVFVQLSDQLQDWAVAPLEVPKITRTIEQFETSRSAGLEERVMESIDDLTWADTPQATRLRKVLDTHYRNANLRIAITGELMNDLLPVLEPIEESVNDNILGASVRGRNNTWTRLRVKLIEDDQQIRLRFVASGNTQSRTVSKKGPVRFFSKGRAEFSAGTELMVSRRGIIADQATATADGRTRVTKLQTDYDEVPLIGWMMRQLAMEELRDSRSQMRSVVRNRVSSAARERLDETLQTRIAKAEAKLKDSVLDPLRKLDLDPSAIEMRSTEDRILLRCRIASESQLAAYTPRPRALRGSVLSLQFHESSANNLLEQLDLDGQRIELEELMERMSDRLDIQRADIHEEIPEGVKLRLGEDRPIQLDFDDDRILITVRLAELSTPRRKWRNFVVRGRYRADIAAMHVDLERDGGIELISDQLGFRDQIALRGIFTKVMARNHRLSIIRGRLASDPRLRNLSVTQFVVRDGWVGVSVGPKDASHVAAEANVAAR